MIVTLLKIHVLATTDILRPGQNDHHYSDYFKVSTGKMPDNEQLQATIWIKDGLVYWLINA